MSEPVCLTQQLVQCGFCSTVRPANELYDEDVCADGSCGMSECCIAKRCIEECTFKCSSCLEIFKREEVVYIDDSDTERIFVCLECYNNDKQNWCKCCCAQLKHYDECDCSNEKCMYRECDANWILIGDGVLKCSSCDAERTEQQIKIWYGISVKEWLRRYD